MVSNRKLLLVFLAASAFQLLNGCRKQVEKEAGPPPTVTLSAEAAESAEAKAGERLLVPNRSIDAALVAPLADAYQRIDPATDGWDSEEFGETVSKKLKSLGKAFEATEQLTLDFVSADFSCDSVLPADLHVVFEHECTTVRRSVPAAAQPRLNSKVVGITRLRQEIEKLQRVLTSERHTKFKIYRVDDVGGIVESKAYFHVDGVSKNRHVELNSDWKLTWKKTASQKPELVAIEVGETELVEVETQRLADDAANSGGKWFADRTADVLGDEPVYQKQLRLGTDHWRARLCRDFGLDVVANHGIAIGDINGDHLEDIYVCQQGGLPNRMFLQQADGSLRDVSADSGTDWLNYSASALLIDLDNDGDKDLAVAHEFHVLIMRNNGTGSFYVESVLPCQAQTFSMAAADYDLDGDLDLFCCGYNKQAATVRSNAMGNPMPYHDAQNGGANSMFRNDGEWEFVNATSSVGLQQNNNRFSFAASWEDYDNDGDLDLYVSNDYGRNNLYRNDEGRFQDVAGELGVEDMSAGMSVSWADANRDGWMDFYVSNMFSAAGNRITYQRQFKSSLSNDVKQQFQRHARGNSLFFSNGDGGFEDVSVDAGVTLGRWAWGSKFCDFNNDGWQDLFVNNGFISTEDTGDL